MEKTNDHGKNHALQNCMHKKFENKKIILQENDEQEFERMVSSLEIMDDEFWCKYPVVGIGSEK